MIAAGIVSILAFFRAGSFIHELTHIKKGELGGFKLGWNVLAGVPLLIPSFLYEGIHNLTTPRSATARSRIPNICRWR